MALPSDVQRSFRLFVTHVDGEGHFLKLSGQLDQPSSLMIESLFETARENLEKGLGAVPPASIHEGVICAAKYKDGSYYRAKIINTSNLMNGLVGVHFIDYGNKDIISLSTIRYLDNYDPMLLQLRGQATDYYLSRIMHPSGRWEETLLLKLQSLLCYSEYPFSIDSNTRTLPLISVQYKGNDLATHLISNRFGIELPVAKQESLLVQISSPENQAPNWQPNFPPVESPSYMEHVPFLVNQNFPSNPASAMRLQQNPMLPFNGSIPSHSAISQRLLVNKVSRSPVSLKAPMRQPQAAPPFPSQAAATPPPTLSVNKPPSPKKSTTYKSRLLEVGSQHKVFVSFAEEGPELFAVQLVTDAKRLQDMMDEINRRPHSSLAEPPMIGTVCLGRMSGDRIICRAIVMNLSGSQCKLFFVDFGDTEMVSYYDIFDIPEEFVKPNVFAMRFCLSGVKKLEKGPHLMEAFKQLVNGKVPTLRVVSPEGPPLIQYGELFLDNKNVLELLMANMKDKLQFKWMDMLPLGSRTSVLVSYVDSCVKFFVQLSETIDDLNAVMDAVKAHCESSNSPGELPIGAACCARFPEDNNWYRARIRSSKGNGKVVVSYVDYGNEQDVNVSDLRTITADLIRLPAQAMKCALKGYEDKPIETKTSNQLEMLALEKTLTAHIIGVLSNDTMLVSLVDDTVSPPLDVARRMMQLSTPRSNIEPKVTTPVRKEAPETFSSPESDDGKKKGFRREKSFKDERRPPRDGNEDFSQRGGSFRSREFDRSGPGRHSDKFGSRQDSRPERNDRRGTKPWERNCSPPAAASSSPPTAGDDEWEDSTQPAPAFHPPPRGHRDRDRDSRDNRDTNSDNRFNQQNNEWENRPDRRDNYGDRRENNWGEKKDFQKREPREFNRERGDRNRSNFTPRDRAERAERSFGSDTDRKSDKSYRSNDSGGRAGRAPPYKPRSKFTQVQYKELSNPVPLETPFDEPAVESGAQHEVSVTWIISPESFYTQILSLQPKFLEMMHTIPELYKGVKSYTGIVPVGGSVLARYPADGVLYRATVVSVQPFSKFIVRYVDFGNKQLVDAKDIWQLDKQLMELPRMAVHCSLLGVAPSEGEWKANPEIDLCFNAPRYQAVFQNCGEEGQWKVFLWNNAVNVADTLVEKGLALSADTPQTAVALKDEAIDLTIIVGQQILCKVTHVQSFDKFYVQLDLEKAALVENAIANFDTSLLTPLAADSAAEGVHCTVKHNGVIFRAILQDVTDTNNIKAVLPDYGCSITTSLANLMILPSELSVYYYQSLECALHNYTADSHKLISAEQLKETLLNNKFIIYINYVDGIRLMSTLYDIDCGHKISLFEPDEGAYEEVTQLCSRAVFNYSFGLAYIAHAASLNEIYLQKSADSDKIAALLDDMYKFYEEGTPEALTNFEVDGLCAAKSADSNWYRATIVSVEETEVKVQFSDYGNSETLPKDSIKKLDSKFFEPCILALVASLGLVPLQDDALNKLLEWTTDKEVQVTLAFGTDGWLASLHLDGVDLSMKLVNEKLATPQSSTTEETKPETPAEEPVSLPPGCTQVYISHIDTPGHFWLQMADKIEKIDEIQAELQANAENYPEIESREMGTVCVAKYLADELWYRAEILDSDNDITTVRFIDYGNTDVLDNQPGLIKIIPDKLKEIERYALKSSVNAVPTGTGEWSEPASEYFTTLVGDLANPVDAMIVLIDVTTYVDLYVNGNNVTDKLVAEGFANKSDEPECGDMPSCFASHINSPSEFWIQLESATAELQSMETAMVDAENFPPLESKQEGVICAAKYPEDGAWYRAQVIVDGSEGTEVLFMDYGNASIADELRSLPDELKSKAALSRKCALQKPRDIKSWSRKSEVKFNELAAEGATVFSVQFIASGDISIVELYLEGKSVTEELVGLCESQPAAERPSPVGRDILSSGKVCFVNSLEEFYVQLDDFAPEIDKIIDRLTGAAEFEPANELKVGSVCAALWDEDEQWYRAKVLEFCDGAYHVLFIDYGNRAKCQEFRQLPEDLAAIEPAAKCCRLAGMTDSILSERAKEKLDEYAADAATFQIEFLDSTKEPALIRLFIDGKDFSSTITPENNEVEKSPVKDKPQVDTEISAETKDLIQSVDSEAKKEAKTSVEEQSVDTDKVDAITENVASAIESVVTDTEQIPAAPENNVAASENKVADTETITVPATESVVLAETENEIAETENEIAETENEIAETEIVLAKTENAVAETENVLAKTENAVAETENVVDETENVVAKTENVVDETENIVAQIEPKIAETENIVAETENTVDTTTESYKEAVDEESELNTSQDLNESVDSSKTVIENKSFDGSKGDSSNDEYKDAEESKDPPTPEKDHSSETLENSSETIKTPERDDSKDSLNTDTGYTSAGEQDKSPLKDETCSPIKAEDSPKSEVDNKEITEVETKLESKLSPKKEVETKEITETDTKRDAKAEIVNTAVKSAE